MTMPRMTATASLEQGYPTIREHSSQRLSSVANQVLPAQPLGTCYELSDCQGNVEGANVNKNACFNYLLGASWRGNGTVRCWEN